MSTTAKTKLQAEKRLSDYQILSPSPKVFLSKSKSDIRCVKKCIIENFQGDFENMIPYEGKEIKYKTWESMQLESPLLKSSLTMIHINQESGFSESLATTVNDSIRELTPSALAYNPETGITVKTVIPGLQEYMIVSNSKNIPCFHKFTSSCFGKFLWHLLSCFGYSLILESIWTICVDKVDVKIPKNMSDKDDFMNKY